MKTKAEIVDGIERTIADFRFRSKIAGGFALEAKRKREAAGPGSYHFDTWMHYRVQAHNWGNAVRQLRKVLA